MKRYDDCIREDGACPKCALSSHGRDCHGRNISKVAWLRVNADLTQTALADKVGVTYRWVQKLESGETNIRNITLDKALALAAALGCEPEDLV